MPIISWDQSYSVRVASIDTQHKVMFNIFNDLFDAMKAGKSRLVLGETLDKLIDYTRKHFAVEELYFDKYSYPGKAEHVKEHEALTAKVEKFRADFRNGNSMISVELMNFLKEWLENHIKKVDKRYSDCLTGHGLK